MHWHQLRSQNAHRLPKCFRSLYTLLGFSLCTSCHQLIVVAVPINSISEPVREFLVEIHTAEMDLWGVVFTHPVGCSRPPSAVNDPSAKKFQNKSESRMSAMSARDLHHGKQRFLRSIVSICTFSHFSTFFELLWAQPGIAPLPPTRGRTWWLVTV